MQNTQQIFLDTVKKHTIESMNKFCLDHDNFMHNLKKYNGVISGSFMYSNFYKDENIVCGDIDVFVYNPLYDTQNGHKYDETNNDYDFYHKFEKYIIDNFKCVGVNKETYMCIDGIYYSRKYKTPKIDINFILVNKPPIKYINENFDMDCCKIIYDGNTIQVYDYNGLMNRTTIVRYNKCTVSNVVGYHITKDMTPRDGSLENPTSFFNSVSYFHLKMLFDVYCYKNRRLDIFPDHHRKISRNKQIEVWNAKNEIENYSKMITILNISIDLDKLFDGVLKIDNLKITDTMIQLVSMIRTLHRIEKYRKRGVRQFNLEIMHVIKL